VQSPTDVWGTPSETSTRMCHDPFMQTTHTFLAQVDEAQDQAKHELGEDRTADAAVWAQLATARSIAALALAAQAIADAMNFNATP
jgi:hypothetical protein